MATGYASSRVEAEGDEMTVRNTDTDSEVMGGEFSPTPPQTEAVAFLVSATELRDRKTKRRRNGLFGRSEAIRRLVELELKAKT
jgi:hypothetical protein